MAKRIILKNVASVSSSLSSLLSVAAKPKSERVAVELPRDEFGFVVDSPSSVLFGMLNTVDVLSEAAFIEAIGMDEKEGHKIFRQAVTRLREHFHANETDNAFCRLCTAKFGKHGTFYTLASKVSALPEKDDNGNDVRGLFACDMTKAELEAHRATLAEKKAKKDAEPKAENTNNTSKEKVKAEKK